MQIEGTVAKVRLVFNACGVSNYSPIGGIAPCHGGSDRVGAGGSQDARREAESNGDEAEQEEDDDDDKHGDSEGRAMAGSAMASLCAGSRWKVVG